MCSGGVLSMCARLLPYIDMGKNILKIIALMCCIIGLLVYLCIPQRDNKTTKIMRKITEKSISAFLNTIPFNSGNMKVEVLPNVTTLALHGNIIAYKYNDPEKTLSITNCNWFSNTTKERLNALPNVRISQIKGVWYLNGEKWNGKLINVK